MNAAVGVVLAVVLAMYLGMTVEICRCDPDPDGCGKACHVCEDELSAVHSASVERDCRCGHPEVPHLVPGSHHCQHDEIQAGDLAVFDSDVRRVSTPKDPSSLALFHGNRYRGVGPVLRAVRCKPPDFRCDGDYQLNSSRLYPRS